MSSTAAHPAHDHHYFVPQPSIYPFILAGGMFLLALGFILKMNGFPPGPWVMIGGASVILYVLFGWFGKVIAESQGGAYREWEDKSFRYGMIWFIASEVMFFAAFFWAFFDASLFPKEAIGGVWPPKGFETFDPFSLPLLNTLILLTSGCTVTWAHHALREGDRKGLIHGLSLTVLLGLLFTCVQAYEYAHAPYGFKDTVFASTFFMATGFHGFHVIVGTTFLIVCLIRSLKGHFTPDHHFGFEAAAWYWHFVDVVWLFLFIFVYIWGGANAPHPMH